MLSNMRASSRPHCSFGGRCFRAVTQDPAYGAGVFYVVAAGVQSSLLGALLTFAKTPWYQPYVNTTATWNLTALEDQQLGGLIMWIPGGLVYLAIALALMAAWMRVAKRKASSQEAARLDTRTSRTQSHRAM